MSLAVDKEGFLLNLSDWSKQAAQQLAAAEQVTLSPDHWLVIDALRDHYDRTELSLANRALVKLCRTQLGERFGSSAMLMELFGGSPAKTAAKIAGLPRPANCL